VATNPSSRIPVVGASGGIAAILVYYGLLFPRGRLRMLRPLPFDLRVSAALVLWLIVQLIGAIVQAARGSQVAYFAHVGGAVVGLFFWSVNSRGSARPLRLARAAR
jgi:membrane associated rhomboid family serine protease